MKLKADDARVYNDEISNGQYTEIHHTYFSQQEERESEMPRKTNFHIQSLELRRCSHYSGINIVQQQHEYESFKFNSPNRNHNFLNHHQQLADLIFLG